MVLRTTRLKAVFETGGVALGCSLNESLDRGVIHTIAGAGADAVFIDLEHNAHSAESAAAAVAHAEAAGITPIVRPPQLDYAWITRLLDSGCQTLLVPHVERADQVDRLLGLARYHPLGHRGVAMYGGANVGFEPVSDVPAEMAGANQNVLLGIVIESPLAVENLPDLIRDDIDFAVIGWGDLAAGYGVPGDIGHPAVAAAGARLRDVCRERDVAYGVFDAEAERLDDHVRDGARLVICGGVLSFVRRCVADTVERLARSPRVEMSR